MKKITILFIGMNMFLFPAFIQAQQDHEPGFFLRSYFLATSSTGQFKTEHPESTDTVELEDLSLKGVSVLTNIQLGGFVFPNFAIHGGFWGIGAISPELSDDAYSDGSYRLGGLGVGFSYYFMPYNVYITPEYHFGVASAEFRNDLLSKKYKASYTGSGFGLSIGKEWFSSSNWGIGVALNYYQHTFKGDKLKTAKAGDAQAESKKSELKASNSYFGLSLSVTL